MARGSRFNNNRLVGPDKIVQLSYIDSAKASLYVGDVIPIPSSDGPTIPTAGTAEISVALNAAVPGTILRFVPNGVLTLTATSSTPAIGSILFKSADDAGVADNNVGFLINYLSNDAPFFVVVPPLATFIRLPNGTPPLIAVEVILDD